MSETLDLWGGEFEELSYTPPVEIIKDQGELLKQRTQNVLDYRIRMETAPDGAVTSHFDILAPKINFKMNILRTRQPIEIYPLTLADCIGNTIYKLKDEQGFIDALRTTLTSEHVRKLISALLTQSKALEEESAPA